LREQGHTLCVLDLEGMTGLDEVRFANLVLGVLGDATEAEEPARLQHPRARDADRDPARRGRAA
jgi:hypothetical protein